MKILITALIMIVASFSSSAFAAVYWKTGTNSIEVLNRAPVAGETGYRSNGIFTIKQAGKLTDSGILFSLNERIVYTADILPPKNPPMSFACYVSQNSPLYNIAYGVDSSFSTGSFLSIKTDGKGNCIEIQHIKSW